MGYSGGRRQLRLLIDRELAAALDEAAALAALHPEAYAVSLLRQTLGLPDTTEEP
jgi:hypothetical protein